MRILDILASLSKRDGERPRTTSTNPHQQLTQNATPRLRELLLERGAALPMVRVVSSLISVPGARAFSLDGQSAKGPPEAFMIDYEFAHIHPPYDGSLHLALPVEAAAEVMSKGWGELHPMARTGGAPPTALMVYGPRKEAELEIIWKILQASFSFAVGRAL